MASAPRTTYGLWSTGGVCKGEPPAPTGQGGCAPRSFLSGEEGGSQEGAWSCWTPRGACPCPQGHFHGKLQALARFLLCLHLADSRQRWLLFQLFVSEAPPARKPKIAVCDIPMHRLSKKPSKAPPSPPSSESQHGVRHFRRLQRAPETLTLTPKECKRLPKDLILKGLTVIMPSRRPVSGRGGACSLSMDHFSTTDDTWVLSMLSSRNPVMFTPLYL